MERDEMQKTLVLALVVLGPEIAAAQLRLTELLAQAEQVVTQLAKLNDAH